MTVSLVSLCVADMEKVKVDRINELARLSKERQLTEEEKAEQQALRKEYIAEWKLGLQQTLDNTYVVDTQGNKRKLEKKGN